MSARERGCRAAPGPCCSPRGRRAQRVSGGQHDRHRDDHRRRHRRPRLSRARRRGEARRARLARVLARHARRHGRRSSCAQHGVEFEGVGVRRRPRQGFEDRSSLGPFALVGACWQSRRIIRRRAPDVVLGFGGFASLPGALDGRRRREAAACCTMQNAVAGLCQSRARLRRRSHPDWAFPTRSRGRPSSKVEWVGNPVRDAFGRVPPPEVRFAGRTGPLCAARRRRQPRRRGAQSLRCRRRSRCCRTPVRPRVVHQAGARHVDALRAAYARSGRRRASASRSSTTWRARYAEADLVVCRGRRHRRSAELAAVGVGGDHRSAARRDRRRAERERAASWSHAGAARDDAAARSSRPKRLAARIARCTRESLLAMAVAARKVARPDAAERVGRCVHRARGRGR